MEAKDGGSAFPVVQTTYEGDRGDYKMNVESVGGMALRDYFAAKAMQGFCTGGTRGDPIRSLADLSYMVADAMLKAREQTP